MLVTQGLWCFLGSNFLKVSHAAIASVALHAVLAGSVLYSPGPDLSKRVSPPSSSLQARLLTYQISTPESQLAPPQVANAMASTPSEPVLAADTRQAVQTAKPDTESKVAVWGSASS